jgi:hypothetical protein
MRTYGTVLEAVSLDMVVDDVPFHPSVAEAETSVTCGAEADKLAEYINSEEKALAADDAS